MPTAINTVLAAKPAISAACGITRSCLTRWAFPSPTNYEEFKAVITALKDAGKTPISLFSAEKWPATTLYSYACIAEGA